MAFVGLPYSILKNNVATNIGLPSSIGTPTFWYDATDSSTVSIVSGGVDLIRNKINNSNPIQAVFAGARPLYQTGLNNLNKISFNSTHFMRGIFNIPSGARSFAFLFRCQTTSSSSFNGIFSIVPAASGSSDFNTIDAFTLARTQNVANSIIFEHNFPQASSASYRMQPSALSNILNWQLVIITFPSGTNSAAQIRINKSLAATSSTFNLTIPSANGFTLNARVDSGGASPSFSQVDSIEFHELIFANTLWNATQISDLENTYFATKFGI